LINVSVCISAGVFSEPFPWHMSLTVKLKHGSQTFQFDVPTSDSVGDFKKKVAEATGIEPSEQKLVAKGKVLMKDEEILQQHAFGSCSSVFSVLLMQQQRIKTASDAQGMNSDEIAQVTTEEDPEFRRLSSCPIGCVAESCKEYNHMTCAELVSKLLEDISSKAARYREIENKLATSQAEPIIVAACINELSLRGGDAGRPSVVSCVFTLLMQALEAAIKHAYRSHTAIGSHASSEKHGLVAPQDVQYVGVAVLRRELALSLDCVMPPMTMARLAKLCRVLVSSDESLDGNAVSRRAAEAFVKAHMNDQKHSVAVEVT